MDGVYEVAPEGDAPGPDVEAPLLGRSPKINHHPDSEDDYDPEVEEQTAKLRNKYKRSLSNPKDELRQFRASLSWYGLNDQSTTAKIIWSRILFVILAFVVPIFNFSFVSCRECDEAHQHPFEKLVQISESVLASVSFLALSDILHKYGLRRTLLLDKIVRESSEVQQGYEEKLKNSFRILAWMLLPTFVVAVAHRVWWYYYVTLSFPYVSDVPRINLVLFIAAVFSWLYRTSVFLFMCVLFRLMCSLQVLRLKGYNKLLEVTSDVSIILKEHMKIRNQLTTISHRFRIFSQLSSLFQILLSAKDINFFRAGDLAICSTVQLTGMLLCLQGAAKITHKAQQIVAAVSKWHALATCSPGSIIQSRRMYGPAHPLLNGGSSSEDLEHANRDLTVQEELAHDLEAFQKRQALVTYLQFARAGISLYGFVLDRGFLYMIFGVTFSSTLFILGKTILA
jgi:hypothetical protein